MPRGDKTGPMGAGPMTGRGAGICAGYGMPGYMNNLCGRGFTRGRGSGMGGGRGWRHQYYATGLPGWARGYANSYTSPVANSPKTGDEELALLRAQAQSFRKALQDIEQRIAAIQNQPPGTNPNQ